MIASPGSDTGSMPCSRLNAPGFDAEAANATLRSVSGRRFTPVVSSWMTFWA